MTALRVLRQRRAPSALPRWLLAMTALSLSGWCSACSSGPSELAGASDAPSELGDGAADGAPADAAPEAAADGAAIAETAQSAETADTVDTDTDTDTDSATDTDSDSGTADTAPTADGQSLIDAPADQQSDSDSLADAAGLADAAATATADAQGDTQADADDSQDLETAPDAEAPADALAADAASEDGAPQDGAGPAADGGAAADAADDLDGQEGGGADALDGGEADSGQDASADSPNPNVCPYGLSPLFFCLKWGVCQSAVQLKCVGNSPVCDYSGVPGFEEIEVSCDGLDNDCNGLTDDDLLAPPLPKKPGLCKQLAVVCQGTSGWGSQDPAALPGYQTQESACDGQDNDCDGQTDEMAPAPATLQAGVCAGATQLCLGSQGWQEPEYALFLNFTTDIDSQCDGLDNDCDGKTDEDAVCPLWQLGGRGSGKVALSADGSQLAWLSMTGVHSADPASGKRHYDHFGHRWEVAAAAFSPTGSQLASVGRNDVLRVYPAAYGLGSPDSWPVVAAVVKSGARWTALAFAADGSAVVAGDDAGALWPVPLASGVPQKAWPAHAKAVTAVAFASLAQGQLQVVISAAADGSVVARPWPGGAQWPLTKLGSAVASLHADGHGRVLVVAPGQSARLIEVANGKTVAVLSGSAAAVAGRFAPDGAQLWTVSGDGHLQRWEVPPPGPLGNSPKELKAIQVVPGPALLPGDQAVDLAVGATRLVVGAALSGPRVLHLPSLAWSAPHGTGNLALPELLWHPAGLLVGASEDGKLRVWDAGKAWLLQQVAAHDGAVLALARGPGWLLTGGSDFALRLWQWPADGTAAATALLNIKTFGLSGPWAQDLATAADGVSAWAAAGAGVQRVGTAGSVAGQKLQVYSVGLGAQVHRVLPSPNGATLLIALDGLGPAQGDHYRLLDAATLQTLWSRSDLPAQTHAAAWHPSGKWLALGGIDTVQLVDAASGQLVAPLPGWFGQAAELAWNAQGTRLLGASSDGSARIWATAGVEPAKIVAIWTRHCPQPCSAVGLRSAVWLGDPAGAVATAGDDGSLMVWRGP